MGDHAIPTYFGPLQPVSQSPPRMHLAMASGLVVVVEDMIPKRSEVMLLAQV
jgi:hypothetical protein